MLPALPKEWKSGSIPKLVKALCYGDGRTGSISGYVTLDEEDCTNIYIYIYIYNDDLMASIVCAISFFSECINDIYLYTIDTLDEVSGKSRNPLKHPKVSIN